MKVTDLRTQVNTVWNQAVIQLRSKIIGFIVINIVVVLLQLTYINLRYEYLNTQIPFWYTNDWGISQLADKGTIYQLPLISLAISFVGLVLIVRNKYSIRYLSDAVYWIVLGSNILLLISIYRIIQVGSTAFPNLVSPLFLQYFIPGVSAFVGVYLITPIFIGIAKRLEIITNPKLHAHPGMILTHASARGGGFVYSMIVLILSIFFLGIEQQYIGFYFSLGMLGILGILDDYQNTHPLSKLRSLENPLLRLMLTIFSITPVVVSGYRIQFVGNLAGGVLWFSQLAAIAITFIWIIWVLNALSWSNGIDGQYCGIIGIGSVIITILALRFTPLLEIHKDTALLCAISAGAALGMARYTWFPSKIMWGFGAISAGLVLAVAAISVQSKIAISFLIILVPFLDSVVTVLRRVLQGRNPLLGDRGHLHHLLLEKGWKPAKIASFYWISSAFFGIIGLVSSEKYLLQISLILAGIVAFVIVLLNLVSLKNKAKTQLFD
jgi:UDP-GlcNAc:undecaprenyl-phosphate/decaprenyl-phosphate GlcNAc-1-phosphate transferase